MSSRRASASIVRWYAKCSPTTCSGHELTSRRAAALVGAAPFHIEMASIGDSEPGPAYASTT